MTTPTLTPQTRSFLVPFLIVVGLALHTVAITIDASTPGPAIGDYKPPPAPSIGPQPRLDDGGRRIDLPGVLYTFTIPAGWALSPFNMRHPILWPAHPHGSAKIEFELTDRVDRDTDLMTDTELAVYARTAVRGWSPTAPQLAMQRTADGSRAYRFPNSSKADEHYYTLVFHDRTALVVTTHVDIEHTPEHKRDVQQATTTTITSIKFRASPRS